MCPLPLVKTLVGNREETSCMMCNGDITQAQVWARETPNGPAVCRPLRAERYNNGRPSEYKRLWKGTRVWKDAVAWPAKQRRRPGKNSLPLVSSSLISGQDSHWLTQVAYSAGMELWQGKRQVLNPSISTTCAIHTDGTTWL